MSLNGHDEVGGAVNRKLIPLNAASTLSNRPAVSITHNNIEVAPISGF